MGARPVRRKQTEPYPAAGPAIFGVGDEPALRKELRAWAVVLSGGMLSWVWFIVVNMIANARRAFFSLGSRSLAYASRLERSSTCWRVLKDSLSFVFMDSPPWGVSARKLSNSALSLTPIAFVTP